MTNAALVAEYFLGTSDREAGDNISNLKLQKLLYYSQGFHLATRDGETLFEEPIEAWEHGPVVPSVYHLYKSNGWRAIDRPAGFDPETYLPETRELLDRVGEVYGQFTAKRLERMTHQEPPWTDAPRGGVIPVDAMLRYFAGLVRAGLQQESTADHPVWPGGGFRFQTRDRIAARIGARRSELRSNARPMEDGPNPWASEED